jgi:hypothetical protein
VIERLQKLPLPLKILAVAVAATVMLALAAGVGVMTALVVGPGPGSSSGGEPERAGGAGRQQEANSPEGKNQPEQVGRDGEAPDRLSEAEYVGTVGDIQANAVEAFLDSHDKLLRYDAITADDVEEMRANEAALEGMADRASELAPPLRYEEQHEVFSSAVDELHEATRLAYDMAADPVAAAELGFDDYDSHVNKASALLQRSNELLGKDYKAIAGVREISPGF